MHSHRCTQAAGNLPTNVTPSVSKIEDELYRSCGLSSNVSPEIFNVMAKEIATLQQKPCAQYNIDALSRGDLSGFPATIEIQSAKSPQILNSEKYEKVIDQILNMTLMTHQHALQHMVTINPLAAAQHIITFPLSPAVPDECVEKKEPDTLQNPSPTQSTDSTTHAWNDHNPFNRYQHGNSNKYKQRECRLYHVVVDLQRSVYHKYAVTSMHAPYGVVEGRQRGYLLHKAADLYPTINNSIQFLYTSMMGMVHLDAVFTTNNGDKLSERIMSIADLVFFVSTCLGLPQQTMDFYKFTVAAKWNSVGAKMQTDWDYIKYIAAIYGKSVSDSFKELVKDAMIEYNPNDKPPSAPSPNNCIEVPLSYHIQPDDLHTVLQMMGISSQSIEVDSDHQAEDDEGKDDEEVSHDSINTDERNIEQMVVELDVIDARYGTILNRLNQLQTAQNNDVPDPYMQLYDFPELDEVMQNE